MPTSSTTDDSDTPAEVCPICGGVGYLRRDLPIDDPNFGKLVPCICRQNQTNLAARYRLYELSNLEAFKTMSFASFSVQGRLGLADEQIRSLQYALSQAQQFAGKPRGWLLLMGSYGCGKTHLAAAIANTCVEFGMQTIFLTVPDLLDWLRYSYDAVDDSFERRFEELRNVSLLVLDDLGAHNATGWAGGKLSRLSITAISANYRRWSPPTSTWRTWTTVSDRVCRTLTWSPAYASARRITAHRSRTRAILCSTSCNCSPTVLSGISACANRKI